MYYTTTCVADRRSFGDSQEPKSNRGDVERDHKQRLSKLRAHGAPKHKPHPDYACSPALMLWHRGAEV